jgi:phage baseplate assembly protein W
MSQMVLDAIDVEIAALVREVPVPVAPFAYGRDLSCVLDLTEDMADVDENSTLAIGQALVRRLITPNGTLFDEPDYGEDIRAYMNRGVTSRDLRGYEGKIRNEVTKDDRVAEARVTVAMVAPTEMDIAIQVTPVDPVLGVFTLTLALTDAGLLLQEIG